MDFDQYDEFGNYIGPDLDDEEEQDLVQPTEDAFGQSELEREYFNVTNNNRATMEDVEDEDEPEGDITGRRFQDSMALMQIDHGKAFLSFILHLAPYDPTLTNIALHRHPQ